MTLSAPNYFKPPHFCVASPVFVMGGAKGTYGTSFGFSGSGALFQNGWTGCADFLKLD